MSTASPSVKPRVDVIVATKDRHQLLLAAIDGILNQDYDGDIRVTVVYDYSTERPDIARPASHRSVRVVSNSRTRGLTGSRNTGLLLADAELIAFCDDDDTWRPEKLTQQVSALLDGSALGCVSGIEIHYGDKRKVRIPKVTKITVKDLSQSRLTGAHPSTFIFKRVRLLSEVGLVDEELPFGYGEDLDLLLRAAAHGGIAVVASVTTDVLWHKGSYFSQRWAPMAAGLGYLLDKHPSIRADRKGLAWLEGQRAFALAAQGRLHRQASDAVFRSLRSNVFEPRAYLAIGVLLGLLKPESIMRVLNSRGRGI